MATRVGSVHASAVSRARVGTARARAGVDARGRASTRARVRLNVSERSRGVGTRERALEGARRRGVMRAIDPGFTDALGVSAASWEQIEGGLFGASLLPYLAFLYFLSRSESACPPGTLFGFKFLLAFVFGTIPFAIYAKVEYDEILANVDVLHGCAESLLTMTNVFIVLGFREGLRDASDGRGGDGKRRVTSLGDVGAALFCALAASSAALGAADAWAAAGESTSLAVSAWDSAWPRIEPANALSLPTWVIHVSSLVEWLMAMGLAWEYSEVTKRPAWKGLTWGMVPCHASGIAACTFHLFFNAPALSSVVAMQAFLTVVGNSTCALAAYRIAKEGERLALSMPLASRAPVVAMPEASAANATADGEPPELIEISIGKESLKGWEDLSAAWSTDSDAVLLLKLALVSVVASAGVKYGSLLVDFPFEPSLWLAFSIIFVPTLLNCAKWKQLSEQETTL